MDFSKRFKNGFFIIAIVSALLLFSQQAYQMSFFPIGFDRFFNTLLLMLTLLGVCIDPTTDGIMDNVDNEIIKIIKQEVKETFEKKIEENRKEIEENQMRISRSIGVKEKRNH